MLVVLWACGASDRNVEVIGEGGTGATSGSAGLRDGGPGEADTGGGGPGANCSPTCSGATPLCEDETCVECLRDSAPRCRNNAPERCVGGLWVSESPCGGTTPACSNGVCGKLRGTGHLATVSGATRMGSIRLAAHGLDYTARTCGKVGDDTICVSSAGLRP